jgi:hypothetical protein
MHVHSKIDNVAEQNYKSVMHRTAERKVGQRVYATVLIFHC